MKITELIPKRLKKVTKISQTGRALSVPLPKDRLKRSHALKKEVEKLVASGSPSSIPNALAEDFEAALKFTRQAHPGCFDRIASRTQLVPDFATFFEEYTYVVLASGFRATIASRLVPKMLAAEGQIDEMLEHFKNKGKVGAIASIWEKGQKDWPGLRASLSSVDALENLPRIGPIVKFHLARNIGLKSVAKPDLHLVRYAAGHGYGDVESMMEALGQISGVTVGAADFALWVWLSHDGGVWREGCCGGGLSLR